MISLCCVLLKSVCLVIDLLYCTIKISNQHNSRAISKINFTQVLLAKTKSLVFLLCKFQWKLTIYMKYLKCFFEFRYCPCPPNAGISDAASEGRDSASSDDNEAPLSETGEALLPSAPSSHLQSNQPQQQQIANLHGQNRWTLPESESVDILNSSRQRY